MERRDFLKASLGSLALPSDAPAENPHAASEPLQRYGTNDGRIAFATRWSDVRGHAFNHEEHSSFHRLQTSLDVDYSRCEREVVGLDGRQLTITVKLLSTGEAGRSLFTIGFRSRSHGCWAFSLGAPRRSILDTAGWQTVVNAANPDQERFPLAGYDHHDWHTFVLRVPGATGPAQLYCDGQFVMEMQQPITVAQRAALAQSQAALHGSLQQVVPETEGDHDYLFIESRLPGHVVDVDRVEWSQAELHTRRTFLPVLRDLDWELKGIRKVENTPDRFRGNPILKSGDFKSPSGEPYSLLHPRVLRDEMGFHLYFPGTLAGPKTHPKIESAIFHAFSKDGMQWEVTPKEPVLRPGGPEDWDQGALGQSSVLKEDGLFRMWYGGYVPHLSQGRGGYAVSKDGLRWQKPKLGLHSFGGRDTNVVVPLHADPYSCEYELPHCIIRDQDPNVPPERRYVLFLHTQGPGGFIVDVATSADGIRFSRSAHNVRHHGFDNSARGSTLHEAAVVLREPYYWWAFVGHHEQPGGLEHYRVRFTGWAVEPDERENFGFGLWRSERTHLAPIPGSWEGISTHVGCVLAVGDEWWIYYTSSWASQPVSIGLATIGRNRMLGLALQENTQIGQVTTIGLRAPVQGWAGQRILLNASRFSPGTAIRAELLDGETGTPLPGLGLNESVPVETAGYSMPLRWRGGDRLPSMRLRTLRVRLHLHRGSGNPQVHSVDLAQT